MVMEKLKGLWYFPNNFSYQNENFRTLTFHIKNSLTFSATATKIVNIFCFGLAAYFFKQNAAVDDENKAKDATDENKTVEENADL